MFRWREKLLKLKFEFQTYFFLGPHDLLSDFPMPSPARPSTVQKQLEKQKEEEESRLNSDLLSELELPSSSEPNAPKASSSKSKDMSQWFSLFADLDPLANPDAIGKTTKETDPNCYS